MRKVALMVSVLMVSGALAHTQLGTRERLLTNEPAGPYTVDLYGSVNPGKARFEVQVGGLGGQPLDGDIQVRLETGSSQQATSAEIAAKRSGNVFKAQAPLNGSGPWWVRIKIEGPQGYAETTTSLEASPAREDSGSVELILLGLLPLAAVGATLLVLRATHVPVFEVRADA